MTAFLIYCNTKMVGKSSYRFTNIGITESLINLVLSNFLCLRKISVGRVFIQILLPCLLRVYHGNQGLFLPFPVFADQNCVQSRWKEPFYPGSNLDQYYPGKSLQI